MIVGRVPILNLSIQSETRQSIFSDLVIDRLNSLELRVDNKAGRYKLVNIDAEMLKNVGEESKAREARKGLYRKQRSKHRLTSANDLMPSSCNAKQYSTVGRPIVHVWVFDRGTNIQ
jgi:hypothetical protein